MIIQYFFSQSFVIKHNGNCFLVRKQGNTYRIDEIVSINANDWWHWVGAFAGMAAFGSAEITLGVANLASSDNTCDMQEVFDFASSKGGNLISPPKASNGWVKVGTTPLGDVIESTWGIPGQFLNSSTTLTVSNIPLVFHVAVPFSGAYTPIDTTTTTGTVSKGGNDTTDNHPPVIIHPLKEDDNTLLFGGVGVAVLLIGMVIWMK